MVMKNWKSTASSKTVEEYEEALEKLAEAKKNFLPDDTSKAVGDWMVGRGLWKEPGISTGLQQLYRMMLVLIPDGRGFTNSHIQKLVEVIIAKANDQDIPGLQQASRRKHKEGSFRRATDKQWTRKV